MGEKREILRELQVKNVGRCKKTVRGFVLRWKDRFGVWKEEECVCVKGSDCEGCILSIRNCFISGEKHSDYTEAMARACDAYACTSLLRSDGRNVIFIRKADKEKGR